MWQCIYIYIYKGVLLSHKKEGGNAICSNIDDLEMILLRDVHQRGKDKHCMISHTSGILKNMYIWNLKKKRIQMNLSRKQTHGRREQTCVWQVGGGQGRDRLRIWDWSLQIRLLCIGWISNKVLLYSTGNYSQHPVINHSRKEYEKGCMYMYKSLCK